jgi:hypothetical protein
MKTGTTNVIQTYKINPDGSFYIIMKPGKYDLTFEGIETRSMTGVDASRKVRIN